MNKSVTHTVHINRLKLIYNEHPKSIGEFIEFLADTRVLDGLLELLAGNFPILEVGIKLRVGRQARSRELSRCVWMCLGKSAESIMLVYVLVRVTCDVEKL